MQRDIYYIVYDAVSYDKTVLCIKLSPNAHSPADPNYFLYTSTVLLLTNLTYFRFGQTIKVRNELLKKL